MKTEWALTEAAFYRLLRWLDEDQEQAATRYEEIRDGLIKIFVRRGCYCAEDLADKTINRVTQKLDEIGDEYRGNKALYFYGVAKHIYQEFQRKPPVASPSVPIHSPEEKERRSVCLDSCLNELSPEDRELVLQYYEADGAVRIVHRKKMTEAMSIDPHLLRVRISRIKRRLAQCVRARMQESEER